MEVKQADIVLCKFYFSDMQQFKNRPVLVLKDNLPFDDFIAIPISSKIHNLHEDEYMLENSEFDNGTIPLSSKLMIRKTFVVSKASVEKRYGTLSQKSFLKYHNYFCSYFGCQNG